MAGKRRLPLAGRVVMALLYSVLLALTSWVWKPLVVADRPLWFSPVWMGGLCLAAVLCWLSVSERLAWMELIGTALVSAMYLLMWVVDLLAGNIAAGTFVTFLTLPFAMWLWVLLRALELRQAAKADSSLRSE